MWRSCNPRRSQDGWIVAYAKTNGLVVVTHEEYAPDARNRVPMPNVCLQFGIDDVNTFAMLRDLDLRFVLHTRRQGGKRRP